MKTKMICLDLDDTTLDFTGALLKSFNSLNTKQYSTTDIQTWELPQELEQHLRDHEEELYLNLELTEGSQRFFKRMEESKTQILFITARSDKHETATKLNLYRKHGLPYEIMFSDNKIRDLKYLEQIYEILAFVDDKWYTVQEAEKAGFKAYLKSAPHNVNIKYGNRIEKLEEVL